MGTAAPSPRRPSDRLRRFLTRAALFLAALILGLAVAVGAWLYWRTHACLPQLDGTIAVSGLSARVEVLRDVRGVPHLRAHSPDDLLFAQGYVTAQDRLWQMDLSRRLAFGELAEIFGERVLRFDIEHRTLGFRQVCERAVAELNPDARKTLQAYARGVNAFISAHRNRLPIEFMLLGYQPRPWQEVDSFAVAMSMMKTLNTTWPYDLMRERIRAKLPPELYADLFPDHSMLDQPVAEPVSESGVTPRQTRLLPPPNSTELDPILAALVLMSNGARQGIGSNNWVISGAHTQSGRPLLANDPHLPHGVPCIWHMIHLKAPEVNVMGVSLPGLPLVIIGHNERIAWGMTNTAPDVQDLYIDRFNIRDPKKYLYQGEWVEGETRQEVIKVRNARDYTFTVKSTRHGPVVSQAGNRDLALRWTALEPHALRFPFLRVNQAGNWQEFTDALRDFTGPMQNFVYADAEGNIGYYAAGRVPIRKQGDGTVPVPGSSDDYEWTGYLPFEELPHSYNPASGILATANGRVVPDGYPYLITRMWDAPYRTVRVFELLRAGSRFTVTDMLRIQTDIRVIDDEWLKNQLLAAAAQRPPESADVEYALSLLRAWDGEARADSGATLICQLAKRALLERVVKPKLGNDLWGYDWPMSTVFLQNVLEGRLARWLPPGDRDFDDTLVKSLDEVVRKIPSQVGGRGRSAWRWGDTILLTFHHPLSGGFPLLGRWLDVGPFPQSGTQTTVKQTTPTIGPSMRMVVDFANLDQSVQNITLGQSGQVFSPHYRDQFDAWYSGQSFPMPFSDSAVEKASTHKLILEPAPRP